MYEEEWWYRMWWFEFRITLGFVIAYMFCSLK